jgi:alanyl-tRNA synthetase
VESVNAQIEAQLKLVEHRINKEALDKGAMALFGKIRDSVRDRNLAKAKLCGGIHVKNTAEIWHFKIISEGAVAAGIRKLKYGRCSEKFLSKSRKYFGGNQRNVENPQDVLKSVASMQDDNAKLKKTN